jgi:hypothetical protein
MIDISLGGLIGAIIGTAVAAAVYGVLLSLVERGYRALRVPGNEDRVAQHEELALLRRGVLALDLLAFCALGYWIGERVGG